VFHAEWNKSETERFISEIILGISVLPNKKSVLCFVLRNTEYGMYLPKELNGTYRLSAVTELYIRPKDILFKVNRLSAFRVMH
jgi:hypothetical protein